MTEKEILVNHIALCKKFRVDFDEPIINILFVVDCKLIFSNFE